MKRFLIIFSLLLLMMNCTTPLVAAKQENQNLKYANKCLKKYKKNRDRWDLYEAVKFLKVAAEENDAEACYILSRIYSLKDIDDIYVDSRDIEWIENGNWGSMHYNEWPTHQTAWEYLNKASELGWQEAQLEVACAYAEIFPTYPIEKNYDKALELLLKLDNRDAFIEYKIGETYFGKGNTDEAIKWMEKASKTNPYQVLPELAFEYTYINDIKKAIHALEEWVKLDKYKNSELKNYSNFYRNGHYFNLLRLYVIEKDWVAAINLSKRLTSDIKTLTPLDIIEHNISKKDEIENFRYLVNNNTAYHHVNFILDSIAIEHRDLIHIKEASKYLYENGKYEQAYKYLTLDPDYTDYHLLGLCQYYGKGADLDYVKAYKSFSLCKDADSLYHLGLCHYNQQGVEKDYEAAFDFFFKASSSNYHPSIGAMEMLSRCYRFGRGCDIDEEKADYWLEQAAKASEKAKETINILKQSE